ncbi:MAG: isocitrate lyase/PEP mutase family protein [Acidiferrobacterales bacterium]|nr:isocitrate lyase/PEP mutase family protein [Acidiferrobacterales bacterium]
MSNISIKEKLSSGEFICAPGAQDMISALIAKDLGFEVVYASGYWMGASAFGLPDVGITTYTQMLDRVSTLVNTMSGAAVMADADTGYGGLINVRETVRGYEQAGVQLIQLEDQEIPKKCGHTPNKRIIPCEEMLTKIKIAKEACTLSDTLIAARTDAYQSEGYAAVLERAKAFAEAGADIIFPEGLKTEQEMRDICSAIDRPIMINMADGGDTPILSSKILKEIGFAIAIFPGTSPLAATAAMYKALGNLKEHGTSIHPDVELHDFKKFCKLIGFEDIWEFERRWADD